MKILQIAPYFYPSVSTGGTALSLYELSRSLVKSGHEVTVYTTDFGLPGKLQGRYQRRSYDGIDCHYFPNISDKIASSYHLFFPFRFFGAVRRTISHYDIVHLHEIYTLMHLWTGLLSAVRSVPYLITPHGTLMLAPEEGRVDRKKLFLFLGGRQLLNGAKKIIALSHHEKSNMKRTGIDSRRIAVIPNGINIDNNRKLPPGSVFRRKYSISSKEIVILYLGRIHPKKGIEKVIGALDSLKRNDFTLIIAGPVDDQKYFDALKSSVEKSGLQRRVIFTGELDDEGKMEAFSGSDIFILPSFSEGLPVTVLEAGLAGLPLIVTRECGISEIEKYKAGIYIEPEINSVRGALMTVIQRNNYRNYYGLNARKLIKEEYNISDIAVEISSLYEKARI